MVDDFVGYEVDVIVVGFVVWVVVVVGVFFDVFCESFWYVFVGFVFCDDVGDVVVYYVVELVVLVVYVFLVVVDVEWCGYVEGDWVGIVVGCFGWVVDCFDYLFCDVDIG